MKHKTPRDSSTFQTKYKYLTSSFITLIKKCLIKYAIMKVIAMSRLISRLTLLIIYWQYLGTVNSKLW